MALGLGIGLHKNVSTGASWTPAELIGSGLEGWWQSGVGYTTSGSNVIQWDDQSGNDRHWTDGGVSSRRPTLTDGSYLVFDGINNLMLLNGGELNMNPSPFTIAYVYKKVSIGPSLSFLARNSSSDAWVLPRGVTLVDPINSPALLDHGIWTRTEFHHGVITNDGSSINVYDDGLLVDTNGSPITTYIIFQVLMCRRVSDKLGITAGHVKEIVLTSTALSGTSLTNLFSYLNTLI